MTRCTLPPPGDECTIEDAIAVAAEADARLTGVRVFTGGLARPDDPDNPYPYVVIEMLDPGDARWINWELSRNVVRVRIRGYACEQQQAVDIVCAVGSVLWGLKSFSFQFGDFTAVRNWPSTKVSCMHSRLFRATAIHQVISHTGRAACEAP